MLLHFLFAAMADVVIELVREGVINEALHANSLVLITKAIDGLMNKFKEHKALKERD